MQQSWTVWCSGGAIQVIKDIKSKATQEGDEEYIELYIAFITNEPSTEPADIEDQE